MAGGADTVERGKPLIKSKHGHHDDTYSLIERRRDALGAHGLTGLSEQSDNGLAKLAQSTGPGAARVLIQCQGGQDD